MPDSAINMVPSVNTLRELVSSLRPPLLRNRCRSIPPAHPVHGEGGRGDRSAERPVAGPLPTPDDGPGSLRPGCNDGSGGVILVPVQRGAITPSLTLFIAQPK